MKKAPQESSESKKPIINWETQKFCNQCGKPIEISRNKCNYCSADLRGIKAIGKADDIIKTIAKNALYDPDPKVRKEAVDTLGDFEETKILGLLAYILLYDTDEGVRKEAADEIGDMHHELSLEVLKQATEDKSASVRKEAIEGLKKIKERRKRKTPEIKKKKSMPATRRASPLPIKRPIKKSEVSGSETIGERLKDNMPWVFGSTLRKPKINFPRFQRRRLSMPVPSKSLGLIVIFIALFILQTGVVYLIYKDPPALGADSAGEAIFLYPSIHDSFIIEGIVASILIFCASMGYIFLYQASKYVYNRKMALRIIVFGVILIIIAFVALQYMILCKVDPSKCA